MKKLIFFSFLGALFMGLNAQFNPGALSESWSTTGNAGTTSSNFLGTTDESDLLFVTNNTLRMILRKDATCLGSNAIEHSNSEIIKTNMNMNIIKNNANIQEFTIYPNPNDGTFSIKLFNEINELLKITITDIRGTIIYNTATFTEQIQLPNPPAGIYIISLIFKDKILTSKFAVL